LFADFANASSAQTSHCVARTSKILYVLTRGGKSLQLFCFFSAMLVAAASPSGLVCDATVSAEGAFGVCDAGR
jgi:hypothetical protein